MLEKKRLIVNCELCDVRKIKEENYSQYENMIINTAMLLVNEKSKGVLNRLPVIVNQAQTIELPQDVNVNVKTINGSYRITGNTVVGEHVLLIINGSLTVESGTEAVLEKCERIIVNGSAIYPKSIEGYLNKMMVNGNADSYPDGSVVLDDKYVLDKYFPLRARENNRYYARKMIIIKDNDVDVSKLISKNIQFTTKTLILPEKKIEECACIFDEKTEFVVVPEGMKLITGNVVLDESLIKKEGSRLFIYGNVEVDGKADMNFFVDSLDKLIVKGRVRVREAQTEAFRQIDAEYEKIEIIDDRREIKNRPRVKVDCALLESTDAGVRVKNAASVTIDKDIDPKMILEKLRLKNCAKVFCSKEQESAVNLISENVARIGEDVGDGEDRLKLGNFSEMLKLAANTKIINAEFHIM